ncbi:MAG: hypothetical protein SVM86_02155 [Candidatus Cloacimonadota bacterium]|nr:hypothetical protein [Candidatus Cloacimonadota bacterium]
MKKITLLLLILLYSFVAATTLQKIYHRNYGEIERIVMNFSSKPDYSLKQKSNQLQVILRNTSINENVTNKRIENNLVLRAFEFQKKGDDLFLNIFTHKEFTTQKILCYKVNKIYKLVVDIFNTEDPKTRTELLSYSRYYEIIDKQPKLAEKYRKRALEIESVKIDYETDSLEKEAEKNDNIDSEKQMKTTVTTAETTEVEVYEDTAFETKIAADTATVDTFLAEDNLSLEKAATKAESIIAQKLSEEKQKMLSSKQETEAVPGKSSFLFAKIISVVISLLLVFFIIKIILKIIDENLVKKQKIKEPHKIKEVNYRSKRGFGTEEFKREVISKLRKKGWEISQIAKELELTEQEVIMYLGNDIQEERGK